MTDSRCGDDTPSQVDDPTNHSTWRHRAGGHNPTTDMTPSRPATRPVDSAATQPVTMWTKIRRYVSITLMMVPIGQGTQAIMLSNLGWDPVAAAWWTFVIMVVPGYMVRRRWVWGRRASSSFRREIFPYWLFGVTGLGVALVVAELLALVTSTTWFYIAGSLASYGTVEIFRFRFLEHLCFGIHAEDS